jgi:hypothetical protein
MLSFFQFALVLSPLTLGLLTATQGKPRCVPIGAVQSLVAGQRTSVFRRDPDPPAVPLSFSLVYRSDRKVCVYA